MKLLKNSLLTLTLFLIFIIVLEIYFQKIVGLGNPVIYEKNILWGYSPQSNQKVSRSKDKNITINNIGTRGLTNWNKNKDSKIVFIGDSVTYGGSYIDDTDTFSEMVCRNKESVECFNAGVNGYGIMNIVLRSKYDSRFNDSSIRIFTIIEGDFFRGLRDSKTGNFIFGELVTPAPALFEIFNYLFSRYSLKNLHNKIFINEYYNNILYQYNAISFGLGMLQNEIKRLESLNIKTLIYFHPSLEELKQEKYSELSLYIKNNAKSAGLSIVDLMPFLINSDYTKDEIYYDKFHLSLIGHRVFSNKIKSDLKINF